MPALLNICGFEANFTGVCWIGWLAVFWGWIFDAVPVFPTYFYWIFEGLIPPGLFIILAHLGICLSATSGAYFLPQCLH